MLNSNNLNPEIFARRKRTNKIGLTLSMGAMGLGMIFLLWILSVLFIKGFGAIDLNLFTQSTPAPGSEGGGLANAIVGSLMLIGCCTLISTPIGVLAGLYLSEYGDRSRVASVDALCDGHHVVSTIDCHRLVCVCDCSGHLRPVFRLCRQHGVVLDCRACGDAHH